MINIYNSNIIKYTSSAIDAINSGWISNHGIYVEKATNKLKEILNAKNIILMANGTCATHCLFLGLKYKYPNIKKIYVPNNCYVAAWNCLLMEYDKSYIEVLQMDINTWNIKTDEQYINTLDIGAAVLIVHNLGNIINVPRLKQLRPDLIFIEDNCEGLFGKYDNIYSGTYEETLCSSISFYGNKIITTGEGGAFITNDDELFNYIKKVYSQGISDIRYLHDTHAYNYRMTNIQAAFLYDQLNDLNNILDNKKKIFNAYEKLLEPLITKNKIKLFIKEENTQNANWIFSLRIINNTKTKDELYSFFKNNNIDSRPFFYPISSHKHLSDINFEDDIAYILNNEVIMIPSSPNITYLEQLEVVDTISKYIFFLNTNLTIHHIDNTNDYLLKKFIPKIDNKYFRYFNTRPYTIYMCHKLTLVICDNEEPVGYAHIDNTGIYWLGICILNSYTNKGIGKKLIDYILSHNKIINIGSIRLTVDNNNLVAKNLYKSFGFEEIYISTTYTEMIKNI